MSIKTCRRCGRQYNNATRRSCPKCSSAKRNNEFSDEYEDFSTDMAVDQFAEEDTDPIAELSGEFDKPKGKKEKVKKKEKKKGKKKRTNEAFDESVPVLPEEIYFDDHFSIPAKNLSHSATVAIRSAKIVNGYGTFLQVIGMALGVAIIVAGFLIAKSNGNIAYAAGGVIIGLLDLAIFAVEGALFRMFSNYIIARLDKTK